MLNSIHGMKGRPFQAQYSGSSAGSGVALTLYTSALATTDTVASDERIAVTDFMLISVPGGACAIYAADAATTGFKFAGGTVAANGGFAGECKTPFFGKKGEELWVVAPTGQVDVFVRGFIVKAG